MISPAGAALWMAARFDVPAIPARKRQPIRPGARRTRTRPSTANQVRPSARLSEAAQAIAPVLLKLADRRQLPVCRSPRKSKWLCASRLKNDRESEILSGRSGQPARKNMPEMMRARGVLPAD